MLEAADVVKYTSEKQDLQLIAETLFQDQLEVFDLEAFLENPRAYMREFLMAGVAVSVKATAAEAYKLGDGIARKAKGGA